MDMSEIFRKVNIVDVENDYEPKYITMIRGKGEILANLRKEVKKQIKFISQLTRTAKERRFPGTLSKALKLEDKKVYRISFNEITKNAVKASLKNPGISIWIWWMHSRRDVCWTVWLDTASVPSSGQKVKRGLSAGRVQSVALRIIADREAEIDAFIPEEYWTLDAELNVKGGEKAFDREVLRNREKRR